MYALNCGLSNIWHQQENVQEKLLKNTVCITQRLHEGPIYSNMVERYVYFFLRQNIQNF